MKKYIGDAIGEPFIHSGICVWTPGAKTERFMSGSGHDLSKHYTDERIQEEIDNNHWSVIRIEEETKGEKTMKKFWRVTGENDQCRFNHATEELALNEAKHLSRKFPGKSFFVMEVTAEVKVSMPEPEVIR